METTTRGRKGRKVNRKGKAVPLTFCQIFVRCCLATKISTQSGIGGGDDGFGSGLLGVTSNKYVTFPSVHPSGLYSPSGECNHSELS